MLSKEDLTYIENNLPYCEKLSNDEKQLLINNIKVVKYNKGEHLHSAGKECVGNLLVK